MKEEKLKRVESKRETRKVRLLKIWLSRLVWIKNMYVPGSCLSHNTFYRRQSFSSEGWTILNRAQHVSLQPESQYQPQNPPSSNNRCVDKGSRSSGGDGRRRVGSRSQSGGSASLHDLSDCLWFPPEKAKALCWLACVNSDRGLCLRKRLGTSCHTNTNTHVGSISSQFPQDLINFLTTNSSKVILTCDRSHRIDLLLAWKQEVPNTL